MKHWEEAALADGKDVEEVTRCKECKHYRYVLGDIDGLCGRAEWYRRYQREDDYCSRAEREEE